MKVEEAYNVLSDMDDIDNIAPRAYNNELDDLYEELATEVEVHGDNLQAEIEITEEQETIIKFIRLVYERRT